MKNLVLTISILICFSSLSHADEIELMATKDADMWSTDPGTNGGDWIWFDLRGGMGTDERARSLVEFDVEPLMGSNIDQAILRLYAIEQAWYLSNGHAEIYLAADAWEELSVTWNNQPAENKVIRLVQTLPPPSNTWAELVVTDIVQAWADSSFENHGFFLAVPDGTPEAFMGFASRDTADTSMHPRLYIEYSEVGVEECAADEPELTVANTPGNISINLSLPASSNVSLKVFDISGAIVENVAEGHLAYGNHSFAFDMSAGVYFVRFDSQGFTTSRKAVVLR